MNLKNYQRELDRILEELNVRQGAESGEEPKRLFLHSCCAPCSSYVLEYLSPYFAITVFYYNPNISESEEYQKRMEEQKRLIDSYNEEQKGYPICIVEGDYEPESFFEMAKGFEECPEGGERCFRCFEMRLGETARRAREGGFDYFATTLTISPLKNAQKINEIGQALSEKYGVEWLPSDFKKRDGYKRSIALSAQYELYRQDYCGCAFSKAERIRKNGEINMPYSVMIDGNRFSTLEEFYTEIDNLLTRDLGWKTGHNMDAFNDLLRGGFGVHEYGERLHIKWINAAKSRQDLGYDATIAYYEKMLTTCHPVNRKNVEEKLAAAREHRGKTVMDIIVDIILLPEDSGHYCTLEMID